jgi:hypothetical protein
MGFAAATRAPVAGVVVVWSAKKFGSHLQIRIFRERAPNFDTPQARPRKVSDSSLDDVTQAGGQLAAADRRDSATPVLVPKSAEAVTNGGRHSPLRLAFRRVLEDDVRSIARQCCGPDEGKCRWPTA